MPKYIYEAYDANAEQGKELTTGTIVCESEPDLAANLGLMGLTLRRFKVVDVNLNPEAPFSDEPTPAPVPPPNPIQPNQPVGPQMAPPPQRPHPMQGYPPMPETQYEDNGVKYMIRNGKLFKEDWIECDKARFRIIKETKTGRRANITEEVIIERLDWKELAK